MIVTVHAAARYVERVAPGLSATEARAAIARFERGIDAAAAIGCTQVKLPGGARLVLDGDTVVTVTGPLQRLHAKLRTWRRRS